MEQSNQESAGIGNESDGPVFVDLIVPPGAEAGVDSLSFECGGQEMDVLVPAGSVAGDVLRIQVGVGGGGGDGVDAVDAAGGGNGKADEATKPSSNLMDALGGMEDDDAAPSSRKRKGGLLAELGATEAEHSCSSGKASEGLQERKQMTRNDGITVVELGDGLTQGITTEGGTQPVKSLHLLESVPSTDKPISSSNNCSEGDGTNRMVWSSGTILAQALTSSFGLQYLSRFFPRGALQRDGGEGIAVRCLELGSGLGVGGLALAHALASFCTPDPAGHAGGNDSASVLLTDRGTAAADLLKENVRRNLPSSRRVAVAAESLLWGNALQSKSCGVDETFHVIIGSDLLYNTQESYEPLVRTIKRNLHPESGVVLLAVRWRKPGLEREFFRRARAAGLKFELWQDFLESKSFARRSPCRLDWGEYGNPESESSNRYFLETETAVGGKKQSLANITEKDMELMNDEEYFVFEELQVQVYAGTCHDRDEISRNRQRKI